jgi:hypothetical protein
MRQSISSLVGPESLSLNDAGTAETYPIRRVTPSNRVPSDTRTMAECPKYCQFVLRHPQLCDLPALDAEYCPEVKLYLTTRSGEVCPRTCSIQRRDLSSAIKSLMVWTEPGKILDP